MPLLPGNEGGPPQVDAVALVDGKEVPPVGVHGDIQEDLFRGQLGREVARRLELGGVEPGEAVQVPKEGGGVTGDGGTGGGRGGGRQTGRGGWRGGRARDSPQDSQLSFQSSELPLRRKRQTRFGGNRLRSGAGEDDDSQVVKIWH